MIGRTLVATHPLLRRKATCVHCHKRFKIGDQALIHDFGTKAAADLREFAVHAVCTETVLRRLDETGRSSPPTIPDLAAEFRAHIARIRAGGPVLRSASSMMSR